MCLHVWSENCLHVSSYGLGSTEAVALLGGCFGEKFNVLNMDGGVKLVCFGKCCLRVFELL